MQVHCHERQAPARELRENVHGATSVGGTTAFHMDGGSVVKSLSERPEVLRREIEERRAREREAASKCVSATPTPRNPFPRSRHELPAAVVHIPSSSRSRSRAVPRASFRGTCTRDLASIESLVGAPSELT